MKKLITLVAVCMMVSVLPVVAETLKGTAGSGEGGIRNSEEHMTPEQRTAKIEERIKKLEEHKARANGNGRTDVANAVQNLIDALNVLKGKIGSKDRESIEGAIEQVKTAREALKKLVPEKARENFKKGACDKTNKPQGKNSL